MRTTKKSRFNQINYEALINFNIDAVRYPIYACADARQLHLVRQARYHETIVRNKSCGFSTSEQSMELFLSHFPSYTSKIELLPLENSLDLYLKIYFTTEMFTC